LPHERPNFQDRMNQQYLEADNQITKASYVPHFIATGDHTWWEWFTAAAEHYRFVGDKMAFSAQHFEIRSPEEILAFFEARFFKARYIFTIRHPVQAILSMAKLFRIETVEALNREIVGWLQMVQLWADFVRTFPNTLTLIGDDLSAETVRDLEQFTGVHLPGGEKLLDPRGRHHHDVPEHLGQISQYVPMLEEVYGQVCSAANTDAVTWQAEQKRGLRSGGATSQSSLDDLAHPIGRAWVLARSTISFLRTEAY